MMFSSLSSQAVALVEIVQGAGAIANRFFRPGDRTSAGVAFKSGGSPVSEADLAVDVYLKQQCAKAFPGWVWFSEESADDPARLSAHRVIIADPIDGTRAFISGDERWCVSVALVDGGRSVLGALNAPALGEVFVAEAKGGAFLAEQRLDLSGRPLGGATLGPKPMAEWLSNCLDFKLETQPRIPSLAYRIALIAAGRADLGLISRDCHDWDIAAADLILTEAGGKLLDFNGNLPVYNGHEAVHPALFAASDALADMLLDKLERQRLVG
jgi:myo-inositol-1(or 4)-monophosphatase